MWGDHLGVVLGVVGVHGEEILVGDDCERRHTELGCARQAFAEPRRGDLQGEAQVVFVKQIEDLGRVAVDRPFWQTAELLVLGLGQEQVGDLLWPVDPKASREEGSDEWPGDDEQSSEKAGHREAVVGEPRQEDEALERPPRRQRDHLPRDLRPCAVGHENGRAVLWQPEVVVVERVHRAVAHGVAFGIQNGDRVITAVAELTDRGDQHFIGVSMLSAPGAADHGDLGHEKLRVTTG